MTDNIYDNQNLDTALPSHDSDIRMRNGAREISMYELHIGGVLAQALRREVDMIADDIAQKAGKDWLETHDRQLLAEFIQWFRVCWQHSDDDEVSLPDTHNIDEFFTSRKAVKP